MIRMISMIEAPQSISSDQNMTEMNEPLEESSVRRDAGGESSRSHVSNANSVSK